VTDYVSRSLLSIPQFIWDHQCPGCPALPLTQSIQGVTSLYLMSVYSVPRSQFCFNQVTDYVSRSLLSIPQFIWGSSVPGCLALPLTQSIQGVTSLYLMSVYSVPRSQFCFNQVTDYVSRSLLSIPQFIWGSSVPRLPGSATDTIYTRCDVTVPDVSVFCAKKSILFQSGD